MIRRPGRPKGSTSTMTAEERAQRKARLATLFKEQESAGSIAWKAYQDAQREKYANMERLKQLRLQAMAEREKAKSGV